MLTHTKKSAYEISQARESARAAYEALRVERDELKLQLVKSNEECKVRSSHEMIAGAHYSICRWPERNCVICKPE